MFRSLPRPPDLAHLRAELPADDFFVAAGANPDDGESLYHSSELADTTCLELVLAAGIPAQHREHCIARALDAENPAAVALYLQYGTSPNHLHRALFRERSLTVIQLLVEHGADVNEVCKKHSRLVGFGLRHRGAGRRSRCYRPGEHHLDDIVAVLKEHGTSL
jgi:hypothetical protein